MRPATLAVLVLAACAADRVTTTDLVIDAPTAAWAGGTTPMHSARCVGADTLPVVMVAAETLAVARGGPDTVLITLPDTTGPLTLTVRLHDGGTALWGITLYGRVEVFQSPVANFGAIPVAFGWPGPGEPTALALRDGRLVLVDYHAKSARELTPDTDLWAGCAVVPEPQPSAWDRRLITVPPGCRLITTVPISPLAPAPDTLPRVPGLTQIHLSPGNWLVSYKSRGLYLVTRSPDGSFAETLLIPGTQVLGPYAISPRGDRVIATETRYGLIAVDPRVPALAFYLTDISEMGGAAFSPEGDTIFAAGLWRSGGAKLLAVDATSGAILRETAIGYWDTQVVAVDPTRPWLYLVGEDSVGGAWAVSLLVYDRASFAVVARLRIPASKLPSYTHFPYAALYNAVVDPFRREIYVTLNQWIEPTVARFSLIP